MLRPMYVGRIAKSSMHLPTEESSMKFKGLLTSVESSLTREVTGEWTVVAQGGITYWPGWVHANDGRIIELGAYTLTTTNGNQSTITVFRSQPSSHAAVADFKGQGNPPG